MNRLRVATRADLPALEAAESACFPGGAQDAWLLAPLVMDRAAWLYEDAPRALLGYALVTARLARPDAAYLFSFGVLPEHRGRGVGRRLFQAVRERLASQGLRSLELYVAPGNEPALRIYRGAGFTEVARHDDLFGPGEHRLELHGPL